MEEEGEWIPATRADNDGESKEDSGSVGEDEFQDNLDCWGGDVHGQKKRGDGDRTIETAGNGKLDKSKTELTVIQGVCQGVTGCSSASCIRNSVEDGGLEVDKQDLGLDNLGPKPTQVTETGLQEEEGQNNNRDMCDGPSNKEGAGEKWVNGVGDDYGVGHGKQVEARMEEMHKQVQLQERGEPSSSLIK